MAHTKQCNNCRKVKPVEQFSKRKASKDGLQTRCKVCNSKDNLRFREEINPEHHAIWQKKNQKRITQIVAKYRKADKSGKIYWIANPAGEYYIGMTQMHLGVRWIEHKVKFRRFMEGKRTTARIPILYDSMQKWGVDNHRVGVLVEFENIDRKTLREYEKECIREFKSMGISLNKQI